jgi:U3 small nucleolar RNA-associated protein 7
MNSMMEETPAKAKKRSRTNAANGASNPENTQISKKLLSKYTRGSVNFKAPKSAPKRLRMTMEETQERIVQAATATGLTEVLLTQDAGFIQMDHGVKTFKLKQKDLKNEVDMNTGRNIMDLYLTKFGPYKANYSRNGRFMLFSGAKGHVASMDCQRSSVGMELQLEEDIYDAQFLHNETFFATAQSKYTYIYDAKGVELHCMRRHERPFKLDFLPYHYLLTSVGHSGWVKWHDISVGEYVAGYSTGHGPCRVLKHNPTNAVSHLGHANGVVSLWSPAAGKALVSMFCHKSPVTDLAIDNSGNYMCTAGLDGFMKVWDLRKYACVHAYKPRHPAMSLDISDKLVAMAVGREVQVLKDAFTRPVDITYLQHEVKPPGSYRNAGGGVAASVKALASSVAVKSVKFRPFEDVLCIGHTHGVSSIVVPGSGEPNFDSFENNPYANPKQRRESEIQTLMTKISHEMIGLDASFVGTVDKDKETLRIEQQTVFATANEKVLDKKERNRKRGKNKISAKLRRRQKNVVDEQTIKLRETLKKQKEEKEQASGSGKEGASSATADSKVGAAVNRFF